MTKTWNQQSSERKMLLQRIIHRRVMRQTGQRDGDFSAVTEAVHNPFATSIDDLVDLDVGDEMT